MFVAEEGNSWDLVSDSDLWEGEKLDVDKEDYVLVRQEDIVYGIACFMAAYLASLKETKACDFLFFFQLIIFKLFLFIAFLACSA